MNTADNNALRIGTKISDRYVITEFLSRGGFGITYAAVDTLLDHKVAIKEFFPETIVERAKNSNEAVLSSNVTKEEYQKGLDKFLQEARTLVMFNKDTGIVHVLDYIEANNTAYMIMEYIYGHTLEQDIANYEGGKMPESESVRIISDIAKVLSKVHKSGIIHRDISLDNIMIDDNGQACLIDFGAARAFVAGQSQHLTTILKTDYAPPEQFMDASAQDARTDIYSIGAIAYRMLTGELPECATDRMLGDHQKSCSSVRSDVPEWLSNVIDRCLALDANNRYDSAEQLQRDLHNKTFTAKKVSKAKSIIVLLVLIALALGTFGIVMHLKYTENIDPVKYDYSGINAIETNGPIALLEVAYMGDTQSPTLIIKNCDDERYLTEISYNIIYNGEEYPHSYGCLIPPGGTGAIDGYFMEGTEFLRGEYELSLGEGRDKYKLSGQEELNRSEYIQPKAYINKNNELVIENCNPYAIENAAVHILLRDSEGKVIKYDYDLFSIAGKSTKVSNRYEFGVPYASSECYVDSSYSVHRK